LSSVYEIADVEQLDAMREGRQSGFIYSRDGNPNSSQLAAKLAALEGAEAGLICASGMAAESAAFLACLAQGDEIAVSKGLYGKSSFLVGKELARLGIGHRTFDATSPETLAAALTDRTRVVFAETLSNPLARLADIPGLAALIRARGSQAKLVIDNTFAPLICKPIEIGADAVTHSLTKLIGGHSDLMLGLLAGSSALIDRAAEVVSAFGLNGNPFESWLALRGVATLALRSSRACASALELAERLRTHGRAAAVHYPGLSTHPDCDRARSQLKNGFGTIVTVDLETLQRAQAFMRGLHHIPFAPSFGDASTTLSHPASTSHHGLSPEQWARQGITPGLIRLSIGIEDVEDLWDDLRGALDGTSK
jgi:cystathionine beta-lyase/cystathionine gamma-synthase